MTLIKVSYPPGKAQAVDPAMPDRVYVYEGKVELGVRFRLEENVNSGSASIPLLLNYQACNDRLCQAPAKLRIALKVIAKGDSARKRQ